MQEEFLNALPWSWQQKVADFEKPGDAVFTAPDDGHLAEILQNTPDESCQLVLSPAVPCTEDDYRTAYRVLKKGGFFLAQQVGSEDCRRVRQLLPGYTPAPPHNLETQLPIFRSVGFRVMFRDQAYPIQLLSTAPQLRQVLTACPHSNVDVADEHLTQLLKSHTPLPVEHHLFLLIGKKG